MPSSRLIAQWRCQKNASRSGSGLTARCMRSIHSSSSSVSEASGSMSSGGVAPVFGGVAVGAGALGVLRKNSTSSSCGRPVQAARSAAVGPKPARQNSRSTMAMVSSTGGGPAGAGASGAGGGATGATGGAVLLVGAGAAGTFTRTLADGAPWRLRASSARTA
jgi:hypothetical protein